MGKMKELSAEIEQMGMSSKKYMEYAVIFTQPQLELINKAKAAVETEFGMTLSYSQLIAGLAFRYLDSKDK